MKKSFRDDKKGQAFSLDVMMALVIITVIIGVSANAMDMVSYKAQDYSSRFSLERATTDAADILIKSPGSPQDWESYTFQSSIIPGLAKVDITSKRLISHTLTYRKLSKLKGYYSVLMPGKILPDGVKSSLILYPVNDTKNPYVIRNDSESGSTEVAVANRTVLADFMFTSVVIGMNAHRNPAWPMDPDLDWEECFHDGNVTDLHQRPVIDYGNTGKPGWACKHFNITQEDVENSDFYIITDPRELKDNSAEWIIDRNQPGLIVTKGTKFGTAVLANAAIETALNGDPEAILWLHVKTAGDPKKVYDAYLVAVPKGTPQEDVDLRALNPQPCFFVLKAWY